MNWYCLYVDDNEKSADVTFHAIQKKASSFIDGNQRLRITYGSPSHTLRAWRYDYETQAWHNEQGG